MGADMRYLILSLIIATCLNMSVFANEGDDEISSPFASTFNTLVDKDGNISKPDGFQSSWIFLGTWSIAAKDVKHSSEASGHGAAGLHNVYTQPGVVEYYQKHKTFPDGAVLIKELLKGVTAPMTTGVVSRAGEHEGWFIMVKDTKNRFDNSPVWGDGWGWALINVDSNGRSVTKNYKSECLGCHIPAQNTDWIYTDGYPLIQHDNE